MFPNQMKAKGTEVYPENVKTIPKMAYVLFPGFNMSWCTIHDKYEVSGCHQMNPKWAQNQSMLAFLNQ